MAWVAQSVYVNLFTFMIWFFGEFFGKGKWWRWRGGRRGCMDADDQVWELPQKMINICYSRYDFFLRIEKQRNITRHDYDDDDDDPVRGCHVICAVPVP